MRRTAGCLLLGLFVSGQVVAQTVLVHPGVLVTNNQLNYVRDHIGQEPWKSALALVLSNGNAKYTNLDYVPHPRETVDCGSSSNPDNGCHEETDDATAAYTQALLWRYTRNKKYATNAVDILNAWANTLKGGHTNENAPLQAAWAAELFTRAAEIVKYYDPGGGPDGGNYWSQDDKDKVAKMFKDQYLPSIEQMFDTQSKYACYNGNWHASGIEAMLNIAVFNRNTTLFDDAVAKWRGLVPAYIYLKSDGPLPRRTPWCPRNDTQIVKQWFVPSDWIDGLSQETCRDEGHVAYGFAAIINAAETARIQGVDLYGAEAERITKAMEFHARFQNGGSPPALSCGTPPQDVVINHGMIGTLEIGYNHYAIRQGMSLPETQKFLEQTRPTSGEFHYRWETLTHGLTGNADAKQGRKKHSHQVKKEQ
ncbi:hypothetical protein GCM10010981_08330 [Dyella nitratireducens]|uniref:Alginate lyase domain-containing protein n=2 Tax=Dyella nitratireducens TaxID=1849580 RepID=A0ABQ1FMA7_9GAMM|nr:hypothetical protein GCM10010981_08330 [Dyella nitratireducens]GLQ44107.1 hypothetical protein GCM10007902_39570 [Dyella nitratireducens]